MSHTTTVKSVPIKDINAIRSAVEDLKKAGIKCELLQDAKPRLYYANQHGKTDFVVKLHDSPYDLGLEKQDNGSYAMIFDEWGGNMKKHIGTTVAACDLPQNEAERQVVKKQEHVAKFVQAYTTNATKNQLTAEGYLVEELVDANTGEVSIVATDMYA